MKDKIARTLIYLLLGLLACHIKMLGCYPFVAVIFGACYLNEENRRLCVPFSYLWMVLFLPIAALFRYGVTFLVWMVVLAIFWHMHILVRRMGQTSLLGMILVAITYGGRVMTATQTMTFPYGILPVLEGLLVAGGAYFTCRGMDLLEEVWHSMQKKTGTRVLPLQAREYSRAMSGLAQSMEALVRPKEGEAGMGFVAMQQELRGRICGDCGLRDMSGTGECHVTCHGAVVCPGRKRTKDRSGLTGEDRAAVRAGGTFDPGSTGNL